MRRYWKTRKGYKKLESGCPTWWGLTALNWHFESQCIPTPLAYYAHHLPEIFLKYGVAITFVAQIGVTLFALSPNRKLRSVFKLMLDRWESMFCWTMRNRQSRIENSAINSLWLDTYSPLNRYCSHRKLQFLQFTDNGAMSRMFRWSALWLANELL